MTRAMPFGGWRSPLAARAIAAGVTGLQELQTHDDVLYWLESRPTEAGRTALMAREPGGAGRELTEAPYNVRSRVHEYGGAAYLACQAGVFFVNFTDQRIYRIAQGQMEPVAGWDEGVRIADLCWDGPRNRLIAVTEQHHHTGEPSNRLQAVELCSGDGGGSLTTLHEGHDFYAAPRVSPDGTTLAFLCWDHPNMPWDGTQLVRATFSAAGGLSHEVVVAGGAAESVLQPEWQADGALLFLADGNGFWNLYRCDDSGLFCVLEDGVDYGAPPWMLGMRHYAVVSERHVVATRNDGRADAETELVVIDTRSGFATPLRNAPGAVTMRSPVSWNHGIACIADFPTRLPAIVRYPLDGGDAVTVQDSGPRPLEPDYISRGRHIGFPTRDGARAFAIFYAPRNPQHAPPPGARPPLLVMSHGGPTGAASRGLSLRVQYYTTRGWAVVDVDYRGSSGYGRAYRDALKGRWGELDVSDCEDVVRHLSETGQVDPARVAIRGGSAGGYTTLAALTTTTSFRAGASHYGIGDLHALARDTHKFESRYLYTLLGASPEDTTSLDVRSPINHVHRLQCPVIFFQGSEDKVVPPNQSQQMVAALRRKGIPVAYLEFDGEGHGFRRAENIVRALEAEYLFFCRVFEIEPPEPLTPLEIDNL